MNLLQIWQESLLSAWEQVGPVVLTVLVTVLGSIIIFGVMLVAAHWAKRLIVELLKAAQMEQLSQAAGVAAFLKRADIKMTLSQIIGEFVRWVIVLIGFIAAVNVLGLTPVVNVLMEILGYVPNVFAAALVLAAGFFVARLADGLVRGALASVDHEAAKPVGRLAYWVVLIVAFFTALSQLKVAEALTGAVFQTLSWATALALGLVVGLGAKDLVSKVLLDWYEKVRK
ncbi:MAG: hypothetical protein HYW38_01220 [Candidatus Colwellbacteria bacterium]|nr:hypothetical protein [Candidatus Colwellbacteria bacterium]